MPDARTAAVLALVAAVGTVLGVVAPAGAGGGTATTADVAAETTTASAAGSATADPAARDTGNDSTGPTRISGCTTIAESGEYVLAGDVTNESPTKPRTGLGACIAVRADDVTLWGGNHTVAAGTGGEPGVVGVLVGGGGEDGGERRSNVTVRNLTTTRWGAGVAVVGAADATLRNVSAVNNLGDGFFVENAPGVRLRGGTVRGSNTGVFVRRAPDADIAGLTVAENLAGVSIRRSDRATVSGVEATGNSQFGVAVFASANATIADSTVAGNGFAGVALARADGGSLRNLTVAPTAPTDSTAESRGADPVGVYLNDSTGVRLAGVSVADAPGLAFYATGDSTAVGEAISIGETRLSFEARDVVLDSTTDAPPLPTEREVVGDPLAVTPTAADARLSLSMGYDDTAVERASATEDGLSLWRFDAGEGWRAVGQGSVDAEGNRASATLGELSQNGTVVALVGEGLAESNRTE